MTQLSQRERDVLTLLLDGKTDGDIAPLLGISPKTVSFHVENAKRKLGAHHRARAVALALQDGLIAFPASIGARALRKVDPSGADGAPAAAPAAWPLPGRPLARIAREADLVARVRRRTACGPMTASVTGHLT